jgi:YfiH family protein
MISAIHAGWKSVYKDIVYRIINFFKKKGSNINNLCATIGPCITEKNYEVQKDFKDKFLKKNKKNSVFFKNRKNKTYFSLNNYVYNQLKQKGIKNIELINKDTFDKKNNFFSARRSIQNNENDFGRNISIIMIK